MVKAVEYDSKFEGGARVVVEIPSNPNEIVEPKLVDGQMAVNTLESAFDFVEEIKEEIIEEPIIVKNENPIVETPFKKEIDFSEMKIDLQGIPIEAKIIIDDNDDTDISFDFPDHDDEDEGDVPSGLF
jgi:hypothetical protein